MAVAAAGATIGSCFSTAATTTTTNTTTFISNSKQSDFISLRIASKKMAISLSSSTLSSKSHYSLMITGNKLRKRMDYKISATVEQEEVSSAVINETENVEEETNDQKEEEVKEDVISSSEEVKEDQSSSTTTTTTSTTNTKLYFGNLPYNCDSAQLAGIIQEYGSPEMVEVLYDKATGRSRGFGFVTMSSIEDAEAVIKNLEGSAYGGRTMRVNFADKPKPKEPLYPETDYKIFVGNLSWSVTSESLIEVFQEYGNVVGARVLYDGETGRSRGYGFVCYSTKEEMDVALKALDGVDLEGRAMRVSPAEGRKK